MKRVVAGLMIVGVAAALGCQQDVKKLSKVPPPPAQAQAPAAHPSVFALDNHSAPVSVNKPQPAARQQPTVQSAAQPRPLKTVQAPSKHPTIQHYTIRKGDTLWSIAKRRLGDGRKWRQIVAANPGLDPTKLRVGEKIVLPR